MSFKFRFTFSKKNTCSFTLTDSNEELIKVKNWHVHQEQFQAQFHVLNELVENGFADEHEYSVDIEPTELLNLSRINKQILDLPEEYPFEIFIQSDGQLNQNTFRFRYGFYDFAPNGTRFLAKRTGPVLEIDESVFLLSKIQFEICEALDEFNTLPENVKTFPHNLIKFSTIKSLSPNAAATLDAYLENQEVYLPEKIKLDVHFINNQLHISPLIEPAPTAFVQNFDRFPSVKDVYPVSLGDGKTLRVTFSGDQKTALDKVKKSRKIEDPHLIQQIIEQPEQFFDAECDLSQFYSDRVVEIGLYKPKFYPFASPYKSEWIPGVLIKDRVLGNKQIIFKTEEILQDFIDATELAEKNKEDTVLWEDTPIPIHEAHNAIKIAKKQFENPKKPYAPKEDSEGKEVLIIKENAEFTEFIESKNSQGTFDHSFYQIDNLHPEITLKKHQEEGIAWLQSLSRENISGGLLADDMGLGKTLQLLYFIEWHSKTQGDAEKPYLIVAPVSLLENWEKEYQKFFQPQNLSLINLYDNHNLTRDFNQLKNQSEANELQKKQILLINYEMLRIYQATLAMVDFAIVALDEAQKIKSPGTYITNASKALKADLKIAMTGTPVENTLVDIWCIMDFCTPGLLGNAKDFAKEFQNPLKNEHTNVVELTQLLRKRIGNFIKRRLKSDVAKDLPTKYDNDSSIRRKIMPPTQLDRYLQEIELANQTDLEGTDGRNQKLRCLWAIRDISDHPYLVDRSIESIDQVDDLIQSSAKLQITLEILKDIQASGDKVIIFADRKNTQKMLRKVIQHKFKLQPSIINGDTPSTASKEGKVKLSRQQTIDHFQSKPGFNVIIMSPLAAGVGLNVTEANHVIHYSRHWNPAKEEQATDRAYRIGQKKDVFVYYPMAIFPPDMKGEKGEKLDSFDEILHKLLMNKKFLAQSTLFPTEQAEVRPDEIFGGVFGHKFKSKPENLTIDQFDQLNPNLFEAGIAALYQKEGFDVYLTPYSSDKGADIVAMKDNENYLIQVKQSTSAVGREAVQQIVEAKKYYENKFKVNFTLLVVANQDFTSMAQVLAIPNAVKLKDRHFLDHLINQTPITLLDINRIEAQRMDYV